MARYILIMQTKKKKFLGIRNLEKGHYIIRPYGIPLRTEVPNGLVQFGKGGVIRDNWINGIAGVNRISSNDSNNSGNIYTHWIPGEFRCVQNI